MRTLAQRQFGLAAWNKQRSENSIRRGVPCASRLTSATPGETIVLEAGARNRHRLLAV